MAASTIKKDRKFMKSCILYDALKEIDVYNSFRALFKIFGNDFMEYPQFEHFYLRFEKGSTDLDYDGRPEYNRNICDLPTDVLFKVLESFTLSQKWMLRSVCNGFEILIDSKFAGCTSLKITISRNAAILFATFDQCIKRFKTEYVDVSNGKVKVEFDGQILSQENGNSMDELLKTVRKLSMNRKTRIESVDIFADFDNSSDKRERFVQQLKPILQSQRSFIDHVTIGSLGVQDMYQMLKVLEPGIVKYIKLDNGNVSVNNKDIKRIYELEQWKRAEWIHMDAVDVYIPPKHFMHLDHFCGFFKTLKPNTIKNIRNQMIRSHKLRNCVIKFDENHSLDMEKIDELLGPLNEEFRDTRTVRHFSIPDSDTDLLEIVLSSDNVQFSRTDRYEPVSDDSFDDGIVGMNDQVRHFVNAFALFMNRDPQEDNEEERVW